MNCFKLEDFTALPNLLLIQPNSKYYQKLYCASLKQKYQWFIEATNTLCNVISLNQHRRGTLAQKIQQLSEHIVPIRVF